MKRQLLFTFENNERVKATEVVADFTLSFVFRNTKKEDSLNHSKNSLFSDLTAS